MANILYSSLFGVDNEALTSLTDPGDAGSTSWDARDGQVALVTLTSAAPSETRTIANPTNLISGRRYSLTLIGAGTDPIAVTLDSIYVDSQNNRYQDNALTLYPGRTKTIEFQYDGTALRSTSQTERIVRVEAAGAFVSTADNVGAYTSVDMNADGVTLSLPHTTTHELTVGDEAVYFNRGAFTGRITTPSGAVLYGSDEFPPGARVTATYVGSNAWALGGSGVDNTTLADMMFPVTLSPNAGIGTVTRVASSWDAGVMRRVSDLDASTTVTFDVPLPTALSFASGDTFQIRLVVGADTANANAVMAIGYSDDGGNFASEYIEIGTGGVSVVAGGADTGNVTGVSTVKTFDRGNRKAYEINLVLTWTGASGANPVLRLIPAYNLDGTAVADVTATNSLDIESIELGAVSEFTPAGGLTKQGTVTSDADAGEGIYTLDASAAAFDFTLPAATGTQSRYMFISGDVATNAATIKVQAGETMNATTDGTFTMNSNGEILLAVDRATGQWDVQVVGASSSTSLHYASREASLNSFSGTDTVITFDTDLDDTGAMITDTSVITVQQDGKYSITFDVSGDMAEVTAGERFIYVVKNVAAPANDAAAQAAAILTDHTYVDNTFSGAVQWSGGGVFDLVSGDTLVLYFAAASASDVIRVAHFNVQQLPADEIVLAGMVAPTPLYRARMTQTVAQTNLASADTQIVFDTTTYDIGGMADPTNNQLVVQADGYYQITANVTGDLGTSTQSLYVKILVNGGVVASSVSGSSASTPQGPTAVTTALLTAGDLITVVTQRPGGSGTVASLPGTTAGTGVYLEATQLPTSTVVDPSTVPVEDAEVLEGSVTGQVNAATVDVITGARTWNDLKSDYAYVRFEVTVVETGVRFPDSILVAVADINAGDVLRVHDGIESNNYTCQLSFGALTTGDLTISMTGASSWDTVDIRVVGVKAQKTVINTVDTAVTDQSASGYMDIGTMRMQWGTGTTSGGQVTVTLPAAFSSNAYSIQMTPESNGTLQGQYYSATTTSFIARVTDNAATGVNATFSWLAVGLKP